MYTKTCTANTKRLSGKTIKEAVLMKSGMIKTTALASGSPCTRIFSAVKLNKLSQVKFMKFDFEK